MNFVLQTSKKSFINTFFLVTLYAAAFFGIQLFLYKTGIISTIPTTHNIVNWDAAWYRSIVDEGYRYRIDGQSNLAFFPLFPLVWKLLHLGGWGICILNILCLSTGFGILCNLYKINAQTKILWLSIPAMFYNFVPYTEAFFFVLSCIAVYGIANGSKWMIYTSLFLLSLTRPSVVFLGPAFIAMALLSDDRNKWYINLYSCIVTYLLPMIMGTTLFIWYEYILSGKWFVFFEIETKYWQHECHIPLLPLTNTGGNSLIWISAILVFVCLFCFIFLVYTFFKWLIKNETCNKLLVLSCCYLFLALLETLLYNVNVCGQYTNVAGICRYAICNPFFFIFLYHFTTKGGYHRGDYLFAFLFCNLVWLSFGSYKHILVFLFFTTDTILILLYMSLSIKKLQWPIMIATAINVFFQIYFFQHFISGIFTE